MLIIEKVGYKYNLVGLRDCNNNQSALYGSYDNIEDCYISIIKKLEINDKIKTDKIIMRQLKIKKIKKTIKYNE